MRVYEINPLNFGKYKHKFNNIMKNPNMCGIFSKSCGHCINMKPEWNRLKSTIASMPGSGSLVEIDSDIIPLINNPMLVKKIQGYPTIMIIKKGIPKIEYSGNRSHDDMYRFFKNNISNKEISDKAVSPIKMSSNKTVSVPKKKRTRRNRRKKNRNPGLNITKNKKQKK